MKSPLNVAKNFAHAFFKSSNFEDEFRLFAVSTQPEAMTRFTSDVRSLEETVEARRSGGLTTLIDTVFFAMTSMREARKPRRALLILSDGLDNHSRYSGGNWCAWHVNLTSRFIRSWSAAAQVCQPV
jgi:Ca-activated chloride channel homolog